MIRPQLAPQPGGILFLGDWPNDEAEIKGVPFVGADGHLLSRALRAANLTDPSQPADMIDPRPYHLGDVPTGHDGRWRKGYREA